MNIYHANIVAELTKTYHYSEVPDHAKAKELMAAAAGAFIDRM